MGRINQALNEPTDKLIPTLYITLNEDQLFYLHHHKDEKRTKLAKKLGIPKVSLNHLLIEGVIV